MGIANWEVVHNTNVNHGIDFSSGLDMQGSFCYATEVLSGPALIAIKNNVVLDKPNVKINAYIRKDCNKIEPFLFIRKDVTNNAYVLKLENNINLYKINISDMQSIPSAQPIVYGSTNIDSNVTYYISFSCYSLLDGSTVFDCSINKNNTWVNEFSHVMIPDITSGDIGFGMYYKFSNLQVNCKKSYFDNIEILTPIVFI